MASLIQKLNRWRLQFRMQPNGDRFTIALGNVDADQAETVRKRVDELVRAIRAERPPDVSTSKWVDKLPDDLHAKLARAGLVVCRADPEEGPRTPTLSRFLDGYIRKRTDVKGSTAICYGHTQRCLVDYFGATRPLDRITLGDAEDWRRWLADDQKLADNTVRRRCGLAKQFFRDAVRRRLITENPFGDMAGCLVRENRSRDYFITRAEAAKVLEACPDAQWRLLFALSRYGGLRCPSEHLGLCWSDVDWERSRITIRSPKTEHHEGKDCRIIPIFPELRPFLEAVFFDPGEPCGDYVITRYRDKATNLRTQLTKIVRRAGLKPWPKLWHNLRATRETELAETFPIHVVCAWIGNSQAVARKHYLQVTDEHFDRAASGETSLQKSLQQCGVTGCNAVKVDFVTRGRSPVGSPVCIKSHQSTRKCTGVQVGASGLEPPTPTV